jgi:hypothetical protein
MAETDYNTAVLTWTVKAAALDRGLEAALTFLTHTPRHFHHALYP